MNLNEQRAKIIAESYGIETDLEKAKKANIGEIRDWAGGKEQKQADGSWKPVSEGKGGEKKGDSDKDIANRMKIRGIPALVDAFVSMQMGSVDYGKAEIKACFNHVKNTYYSPNRTNESFAEQVAEALKPKMGGQWRFISKDMSGTKEEFVKESIDYFLKIVL